MVFEIEIDVVKVVEDVVFDIDADEVEVEEELVVESDDGIEELDTLVVKPSKAFAQITVPSGPTHDKHDRCSTRKIERNDIN